MKKVVSDVVKRTQVKEKLIKECVADLNSFLNRPYVQDMESVLLNRKKEFIKKFKIEAIKNTSILILSIIALISFIIFLLTISGVFLSIGYYYLPIVLAIISFLILNNLELPIVLFHRLGLKIPISYFKDEILNRYDKLISLQKKKKITPNNIEHVFTSDIIFEGGDDLIDFLLEETFPLEVDILKRDDMYQKVMDEKISNYSEIQDPEAFKIWYVLLNIYPYFTQKQSSQIKLRVLNILFGSKIIIHENPEATPSDQRALFNKLFDIKDVTSPNKIINNLFHIPSGSSENSVFKSIDVIKLYCKVNGFSHCIVYIEKEKSKYTDKELLNKKMAVIKENELVSKFK